MIAKFVKNRPNFLSLFFLIATIFATSANLALAENYVDTTEVVKEIEKTLLFDKSSRQQINSYKPKELKKKKNNSLTINHSDKDFTTEDDTKIEIIVVDPKSPNFDAREKEKLAYNAALNGQYEVSIELYKQVLAIEPENNYTKFSLAVVYQKLGQNRQAKTIYYDILKSDYENKEQVIGNLLSILVDESPRDALYLLSRLTAENPQSSYILAQAALAYDKAKNYDQAIALLKQAIIYDPTRIDYKYNLAVIYDKTSEYDNAFSLYSEVLKSGNSVNQSIPIDQIKKRVEFIRNK
ncbi:MAG: hypothetical protein EBS06_00305 [Proteobacteria bacterium]|nr:hypothetical protein [Pseudomonadota bacterium]